MMKVLLGRVLPVGAAAALLASSASPLQPALSAFTHAANALGGAQSEDTSDLQMPDEASVQAAIGGGVGAEGFSLSKMFKNLFGPSESDKAKAQLDQIIANVKGRSAGGQPGITPDGQVAAGKAGKARAPGGKAAGGKATAIPQGAKQPGKAAATTPTKGAQPPQGGTEPGGAGTEPAAGAGGGSEGVGQGGN